MGLMFSASLEQTADLWLRPLCSLLCPNSRLTIELGPRVFLASLEKPAEHWRVPRVFLIRPDKWLIFG